MTEKEKDKEVILKKLLKNILEERLSRLEKRNQQQLKDLKLEQDAYKKQEILVKKYCSIKIEPKKQNAGRNTHNRDKTPNNLRTTRRNFSNKKKQLTIRSKTPDAGIRKRRPEKKDETKTDIRPIKKRITKNNNNIPSYMMGTSSNANKTRRNNDKTNDNNERNKRQRRARTTDVKRIKKPTRKSNTKAINNIETNLKLGDLKIDDMQVHVPLEEKKVKKEEKKEKITFNHLINEDKIIKSISSFLDKETRYNLFSCNKKLIKYIKEKLRDTLTTLETKNNISESSTIQDQIHALKFKYTNEQFDTDPPKFSLTRGTIKAIELLNNEDYGKIFHDKELLSPLDSIIFVYRIFFQFLKDNDLKYIQNDHLFWIKASDYILEKSNGKIGDFFRDSVENFDFDVKNIFEAKRLVYGKEDQLKPAEFRKICVTTGLVIFLIKDTLEYCGIVSSLKKNIPSICLQYLEYIAEMQSKIKNYLDNIMEWTENA